MTRRFGALLAGLCCATAIAAVDTPEAATAPEPCHHPEQSGAPLAFSARDAEGRRPPQSSVGCDLRRELSPLGGRGWTLPRDGDDDDRGRDVRRERGSAGRERRLAERHALQSSHRRDVDAQSESGIERPRPFLRHLFAVQPSLELADRRHARGGRVARRRRACELSRADADARRRRRPAGSGRAAGWDADLGRQRDKLLAAGFRDAVVGEVRKRLDAAEARRNELLRMRHAEGRPGCLVTIRYISQVARAGTPEAVFAQIARRLRSGRRGSSRRRRSIWSSRRTIRPRSGTSRCTCR